MMSPFRRQHRSDAGSGPAVVLTDDQLVYRRASGARTELDLADLTRVSVFADASGQCFWHIEGKGCTEAIVPVDVPGESLIRQYLSQWRGFDYDGLVRFVSEGQSQGHRQLWPLTVSTER
ncbi:hypothetical protein [Saccharospirillum alexandrii]|uniref:hypothetical protein n=1 Tax=Saccharospirillum alexandrii TaxID=2448477 RepID=UPI0037370B0D